MNRVHVLIGHIETLMKTRIESGAVTESFFAERAKGLDLDLMEYVSLQEKKSLAVASGKLTLEEGQTIYALLDGGPEEFNQKGYAIKAAISVIHMKLMTGEKITAGL